MEPKELADLSQQMVLSGLQNTIFRIYLILDSDCTDEDKLIMIAEEVKEREPYGGWTL